MHIKVNRENKSNPKLSLTIGCSAVCPSLMIYILWWQKLMKSPQHELHVGRMIVILILLEGNWPGSQRYFSTKWRDKCFEEAKASVIQRSTTCCQTNWTKRYNKTWLYYRKEGCEQNHWQGKCAREDGC